MKYFIKAFTFYSLFLVIIGCKKNDATPESSFTVGYDIFITGQSNGSAAYWKNGAQVTLTAGGIGKSIAVSQKDIYVCGEATAEVAGKTNRYTSIWKNGIIQILTANGPSTSYSIGVLGNDIYVAGNVVDSIYARPVYWKNGALSNLSQGSGGYANCITFAGGDFYVAGKLGQQIDTAVVWKNGFPLPYYSIGNDASITKISFSGSDLYAVGSIGFRASYFKNDSFNFLSADNSTATGISIKGKDLLISGNLIDANGKPSAVFWKNGVMIKLAISYSYSYATDIGVAGDDIYIIGTIYENAHYIPVYWKNGVMVKLSSSGNAYGLTIKIN